MSATNTAPSTVAPQEQQRSRAACAADDEFAVPSAATSTSYRTVHGDGSAMMGIAALAANAELSGTTATVPPSKGSSKPQTVVETDEFADFHPFSPPAALPQLSPCLDLDAWGDDDCDASGGDNTQPKRRRRRFHSNTTDSFTSGSPSFDEEGEPVRQPSPHAVATAFTPLREGGKIERTKELMERVALVKAQFRARQLALAAGRCPRD